MKDTSAFAESFSRGYFSALAEPHFFMGLHHPWFSSLEVLSRFYKSSGRDARVNPWSVGSGDGNNYAGGPIASDLLEGSWVNMSRPNYVECLGKNKENDFMYSLGRMSL